jgi:hypothetical protein
MLARRIHRPCFCIESGSECVLSILASVRWITVLKGRGMSSLHACRFIVSQISSNTVRKTRIHDLLPLVDLAIEPGVHALGYIMPCTCT